MDISRKEIIPGIWLSCLCTDKFKSNCLSVSLLTQLDKETISKNALITRVLSRGTVAHPDMESLAAACDELYGAKIIPIVRKKGEILCLGFYSGFIDDRFTPDGTPLLEPVASLIGEMLLSPLTRGGLLIKDYVESEKEKLIDDIRAQINDKRGYAAHRLVQEMFVYEDYAIDEMGNEEGAETVNYIDLTHYYKELLAKSPVEIFYCGSADAERVEMALIDAFLTFPRGELDYEIGTDIRMNTVEPEPRFFTEQLAVTQGKLVMGFRLGKSMEDPDFAALRVFNCLFGGGVTSKLFMNVREKLSLCYYASSSIDRMKGVMIVSSGIEFDKVNIVREEILKNLEAVKNGDFTADELVSAKSSVTSDLIAMTDSPGSLEEFFLSQTLTGLELGPEELAGSCSFVTAPDVIAIAKNVELDAVYFLEGNGELVEEDENADF